VGCNDYVDIIVKMEHLEGRMSVLAALRARRRKINTILLSRGIHEEPLRELLDAAAELSVPVQHVDRGRLDALAHGATHGGVIAICSGRELTSETRLLGLLDSIVDPLLLLLEGIDDARNMGFVLRSAEAMGAHAVLIKKHLGGLDPVEIARPSSGAYERLEIVQIEGTKMLSELSRRGVQLVAAVAAAKKTIDQVNMTRPTLLCIGGEKRGLSGAVRDLCDTFASIPIAKETTSLSLSHAAAMVLYEAARQRGANRTSDQAMTEEEIAGENADGAAASEL
jgi:23S rRNA (guanosine2251-2'-O)-methyltransferase